MYILYPHTHTIRSNIASTVGLAAGPPLKQRLCLGGATCLTLLTRNSNNSNSNSNSNSSNNNSNTSTSNISKFGLICFIRHYLSDIAT